MVGFGLGSFGLITLGLGWFEAVHGVAGPVTDLGYGALVGIILTMGLLVQLRAPESGRIGEQEGQGQGEVSSTTSFGHRVGQ